MNYHWLNTYELPNILGNKIILFGAGNGSEDLLRYIKANGIDASISCVADNDTTMTGKSFHEYTIINPKDIPNWEFDKIIVTTVSGRDTVSQQLSQMGYLHKKDFFLVGNFPTSTTKMFEEFFQSEDPLISLHNKICLNIGPGGMLGFEVLLYCFGAQKVFSIDKNSFGINYPDITTCRHMYEPVKQYIESYQDNSKREYLIKRFKEVIIQHDNQTFINEGKISFNYPMDLCDTHFPDNMFDFVFTSGVLEHVEVPSKAVHEITRILKSGAYSVNKIITRDHRSFSSIDGYDPFSYRLHSEDDWHIISSSKFFQNRLLPVEWQRLFTNQTMNIAKYKVIESVDISNETKATFDPIFKQFSDKELGEIDCFLVGKKTLR